MKKTICTVCFIFVCLLMLRAQTDTVHYSSPGGFYETSFALTLRCQEGHHIRYTTNGHTPTATSTLYQNPLFLDERLFSDTDIYKAQISPDYLVYVPDSVRHIIVIRAAVFDANDSCIGPTVTHSYLIHSLGFEEKELAVVSICADSLSLFDYNTGLFVPGVFYDPNDPEHTGNYYQKGKDWERPVNVEFYEPDDNTGINQICGLRTHGNRSRRYPAKGMKIYAREECGIKRFKHAFFNDTPINSYKRLVLKPFANFEPYSGIQDPFCCKMAVLLGLEAPHSRPIIVYLNGEYWGIYFLQEKMDDHYLEDHFGVNTALCNIISHWKGIVDCGNNINFLAMMEWFNQADLSNDSVYQHAGELIDIDNFIDYNVLQTFIGNWDWPGNNMRCWQEGHSRWRWIFFDGDATLMSDDLDEFANAAVYEPPTTWINFPEAKLLLGKLMQNNHFKTAFKKRAYELCDGLFLSENTAPILNELIETLRPRIQDQRHRFGYPPTDALWNHGNDVIQTYLHHRVENYLNALEKFCSVGESDDLLHGKQPFYCFPNPSDGHFWIQLNEPNNEIVELQIYDITGTLVHKESLIPHENSKFSLYIPHQKAGLYLIKIGNQTQRIVIQ